MQKLYIKHLGPIEECEINIEEFMVCTGPQASGKSTIAKSIFFFKNIKNILFVEYKKKYLLNRHVAESRNVTVKQRFMKEVRANFIADFWNNRKLGWRYVFTISIYGKEDIEGFS